MPTSQASRQVDLYPEVRKKLIENGDWARYGCLVVARRLLTAVDVQNTANTDPETRRIWLAGQPEACLQR